MIMDEFEAQRDLIRRLRTEGAEAAYQAALDVCRDPKATAQSKATASSVIFRAAGYFNTRDDGAGKKQAHEMTAEELNAELERLRTEGRRKAPGIFD
jgi:hypothetical protein